MLRAAHLLALVLAACSGAPALPKGPPPEYEEEPSAAPTPTTTPTPTPTPTPASS